MHWQEVLAYQLLQRLGPRGPAKMRSAYARGASTGACAVDIGHAPILAQCNCTENGTSNAKLSPYSQFVNRKRALLSTGHYLNSEQLN